MPATFGGRMREWDGFLAADDYGATEGSASLAYSESEAVAVSVEVAVEVDVNVNEVHVAETVEVVAVAEAGFESYLSVSESYGAAGSSESEASLGHASDDDGLAHAHDYGYDDGHHGDAAFDGPDVF